MSILKKLKFSKQFSNTESTPPAGGAPRDFFPDAIGIYCIDNPKLDRREAYPKIIGIPPTQVTKRFVYRDAQFNDQQVWLGRLYQEPVVVQLLRYDPYALEVGTDNRLFPFAEKYDKKLPIIPESGVTLPEFYDVMVSANKRLEEIDTSLARAKKDSTIRDLQEEKSRILADSNGADTKIRITKAAKTEQKIFLPIITAIKNEEEDENGDVKVTFTPKLVIFQLSPGVKQAEALVGNKILENKYDLETLTQYLVGDIDDFAPGPLMLFNNKLANDALTAINYPEDIKKSVAPFFDAALPKPISEETLFRIIILELIGLYPRKDEEGTLEKRLKTYFYSQLKGA